VATKIDSHYYQRREYDSKQRFISYWHQINEVLVLHPSSVLEIGIGNGFVSQYLKHHGVNITTCDNDQTLSADYTASIIHLPFDKNSFEAVTAYEVLEHMPYQEALKALRELHKVSSRWVIISLPEANRSLRFEVPVPKVTKVKKLISLPYLWPPKKPLFKGHFWEIGQKGYSLKKILQDIKDSGFKILRTYRVFENPRHRFFILEKLRLSSHQKQNMTD